jgi:hypothetical protein
MYERISIRYEGGDAVSHTIDLNQLGQSLQGFGRILATCAHFVETGKYTKQLDSLSVRVVASEPDKHRCYEVWAYVRSLLSSDNMWSGAGGAVLATVVAYVLSRRSGEEMKLLKDALDKALANNAQTTEKLISTIDRMAEALRPSARLAATPIDKSCSNIDLYSGQSKIVDLDHSKKEYFSQPARANFLPTRCYSGTVSELDVKTGSCKVSLGESEQRLPAEITDPIRVMPNNPYALALASQQPISFMAKAELDEGDDITKLYISDLA